MRPSLCFSFLCYYSNSVLEKRVSRSYSIIPKWPNVIIPSHWFLRYWYPVSSMVVEFRICLCDLKKKHSMWLCFCCSLSHKFNLEHKITLLCHTGHNIDSSNFHLIWDVSSEAKIKNVKMVSVVQRVVQRLVG